MVHFDNICISKLIKGCGSIKNSCQLIIPSLALIVSSLGLITSLPANRFPNISTWYPDKMPRNLPVCSFVSFWIVSLTYFIKPNYLRDLLTFTISFISSFEIISVVTPDAKIFFWIATSVAATAVSPNGI